MNADDPVKASVCMYCYVHGCTRSVKMIRAPPMEAMLRFAAAELANPVPPSGKRTPALRQAHLAAWPA